MTSTNPLVKCPKCEKYTNPIPRQEYFDRTKYIPVPPLKPADAEQTVCEYCGWKIKVTA